jgi:hypothetical protein
VNSLAGAARTIALRLGEPEEARLVGHGLELLPLEEPVGQVSRHGGGKGGDEAVLSVGAEGEVGARIQRRGLPMVVVSQVSGVGRVGLIGERGVGPRRPG